MRGILEALARRIVRRGLRRGLLEGNYLWLAIALAVWVARLLVKPEEPIVRREELALGETLIITHRPPRSDD